MAVAAQNSLNIMSIYDRLSQHRQEREQARVAGDTQQVSARDHESQSTRQQLLQAAEQATPEEIAKVQNQMRLERAKLDGDVQPHQGLGQVMEGNSQAQEHGQARDRAQDWSPSRMEDLRAARRPQAAEPGQGWDRQQGDTPRLDPSYGAAADTNESRAADRQLEEDQRTMHLALGRPATDQEMQDFQARRAEQETQQHTASEPLMTPGNEQTLAQARERRQAQSYGM